ncbi:GNAT family N-acetyltransferase [bacterium]|nr:MAG: GNAT family N-acetyltransferase [bacterium]
MQTREQKTSEVILVLATPDDAKELAEAMRGAELKNFAQLQNDVTDEEERAYLKRKQDEGSLIYLVMANGRIVGTVGLHEVDMFMRIARIGVTIFHSRDRHAHYGRIAMTKLIELAFTVHGIERLEAKVVATNQKQIAWDESFGFVREGLARGKYLINEQRLDMVTLGLLKTDWLEKNGGNG